MTSYQISEIISNLTLEEKLSQLFIVGYFGTELNIELSNWISSGLGGVVFFRDNIKSYIDVARTIYKLQNSTKNGLFIAVDEEGGLVERIKGVTQVPTPMALASINDEESIFLANKVIAEELSLLGFNMNYSPVLDINVEPTNPVIGVRSFGDNVEEVGKYGLSVIESMRLNGVIPVAKHFPGHGASKLDSHLNLPIINISDDELNNIHIAPFKEAIKNNIEVIMVCHACFPSQGEEDNLPASLSKNIISNLLKEKLGFNGIIITDDLDMKAISDKYTTEIAAIKAINAGVDILLYRDYRNARKAYYYLLDKLNKDKDLESKINESIRKILGLKCINSITKSCYKINESNIITKINTKEKIDLIQSLFDKSISVYKDYNTRKSILNSDSVIIISVNRNELNHYKNEEPLLLSKLFGNSVKEISISVNPIDDEIKSVMKQIENKDKVIIIPYNAQFNENQVRLFQSIIKCKEVFTLITSTPYEVLLFDEAKFVAVSCCYSNGSIKAFYKILTLDNCNKGCLPVKLPL